MRANTFLWAVLFAAHIAQASPIKITPLDQIAPDSVGLISAQVAELPFDFWGTTPVDQAKAALFANTNHRLPALTAFMLRLTLAELSAPIEPSTSSDFLAARVDYLLNHGALDQADAILNKIGATDTTLFNHWFDTKLLLRRFAEACNPLIYKPYLSDNKEQQIYCLAQNNRWLDALLLLDGARALGEIPDEMAHLLAAYLDPETTEIVTLTRPDHAISVLYYILHEALALPPPTIKATDLRFAHEQMGDQFGWQSQIRAGERLARKGAIPAQVLAEVYANGVPAASGGVWDRVRLWQNLDQALLQPDTDAICQHLLAAWPVFVNLRLEGVFARYFAQRLTLHDLPDYCVDTQINALLFHPNYASLLFDLPLSLPRTDPRRELLQTGQIISAQDDPLIEAIRYGLMEDVTYHSDSGALLFALADISNGVDAPPHHIETALKTLRANRFNSLARQVGLQLLAIHMSQ